MTYIKTIGLKLTLPTLVITLSACSGPALYPKDYLKTQSNITKTSLRTFANENEVQILVRRLEPRTIKANKEIAITDINSNFPRLAAPTPDDTLKAAVNQIEEDRKSRNRASGYDLVSGYDAIITEIYTFRPDLSYEGDGATNIGFRLGSATGHVYKSPAYKLDLPFMGDPKKYPLISTLANLDSTLISRTPNSPSGFYVSDPTYRLEFLGICDSLEKKKCVYPVKWNVSVRTLDGASRSTSISSPTDIFLNPKVISISIITSKSQIDQAKKQQSTDSIQTEENKKKHLAALKELSNSAKNDEKMEEARKIEKEKEIKKFYTIKRKIDHDKNEEFTWKLIDRHNETLIYCTESALIEIKYNIKLREHFLCAIRVKK
ncbi:hypothetical protein K4H28_01910 [Deefgea tanakiae]|uniref:Lipoprotein n=1 Tax=Deefgea tanakiae TaxID=2865840 RepID=A0ABX8Z6I1_9NEIS|nr:hypothetical protein [Deefgea tanakiae]QZA78201.1 hypothetical protein K4H28_01910 [Deefgea tanakiae]